MATPLGTPAGTPARSSGLAAALLSDHRLVESPDALSETDSQKSLRMRRKLPLLPPDQEAALPPSVQKKKKELAQQQQQQQQQQLPLTSVQDRIK